MTALSMATTLKAREKCLEEMVNTFTVEDMNSSP